MIISDDLVLLIVWVFVSYLIALYGVGGIFRWFLGPYFEDGISGFIYFISVYGSWSLLIVLGTSEGLLKKLFGLSLIVLIIIGGCNWMFSKPLQKRAVHRRPSNLTEGVPTSTETLEAAKKPVRAGNIIEKSDLAVHGRAIFPLEGETPAINYDKNGQHTVTFPNGDKYIGEFRDKKPNGLGTYNFVDGRKYVGEFLNGGINGKGEYFFVGGHKYCGEHIDGNFNGRGTLTLADGRKYIGEFRDDRFHGHGTYKLANGDKYVGEWADDKYNGKGTFTSANGDKYIGEWRDNKRNGHGTYKLANGDKYVGEWVDDKYDKKFEKINAFDSLIFQRDVAPKSFQSSKNIKKTKRSIYRGVKSLKEDDSPKSNDRNLVQPRFIKNTIEVATHEGVDQVRPIPTTGLLESKKKWRLAGSELLNVQTGEKFLVVDKLSLNRQEIRREGTGYVFALSSTYAYVSDWYIETR